MTQDPTVLEDYDPVDRGEQVECSGGKFLPVAGYRRLCLLVDQGDGNLGGASATLRSKG